MGEHKFNPKAAAAAAGAFRPEPGSEIYGFQLIPVVELNKEKMAELVAILDAAKLRGEDPRHAIPQDWTPIKNPGFFDYVVYNVPTLGRPSVLSIRSDQIPTATIRWNEHLRIPLPELRSRADMAFAGAEERGPIQ